MTSVPKGTPVSRIKPKRLVDKVHLAFVAEKSCCCCGARPVQVHHLLKGDPARGMSRKAGDQYTIPCCPTCHNALHMAGNETEFLARYCVDGPALAAKLWSESHGNAKD